MDLLDLLRGLHRAPWNGVARKIVGRAGFDTSLGYQRTVDAMVAAKPDQSMIDDLTAGITEHLVAGEKFLQLVQLTSAEKNIVERWCRAKRKASNQLADAFPGSAPESVLITHATLDPTSVGYVCLEDGMAALFASARFYVKSEPVSISKLKASAAAGYEKLVGYKRIFYHAYDGIWIPSKGDYAVLVVDLPAGAPNQGAAESASLYLQKQLRSLLGRTLKLANFWHAIDGLYRSNEGKLVDYGFSAGGQSVNHHKARRTNAVCLRSAIYDAAGAAAVVASGRSLELFKDAIEWSRAHPDKIITYPEVSIPGKAADLNKAMPIVSHCIVRNCLNSRDLAFVTSKIAQHVKHWV